MNARLHFIRLENSGVVFGVENGNLSVDAPAGLLTDEDRAALIEGKADIMEVLQRRERKLQAASERGFVATYSKVSGYVALHDPLTGEWHDFPTSSCLPSVVEEAKARARKRKAEAHEAREPQANAPRTPVHHHTRPGAAGGQAEASTGGPFPAPGRVDRGYG